MSNFNEHALEMSIMELFQNEGYTYANGSTIHREKTEVLLLDDLKSYLLNRYSADGVTLTEIDAIVQMLRYSKELGYEIEL